VVNNVFILAVPGKGHWYTKHLIYRVTPGGGDSINMSNS
jgi:hypothetical protein